MINWYPGLKLQQAEDSIIFQALKFYQGNKEKAAESCGVSTKTIYNKVEKNPELMPPGMPIAKIVPIKKDANALPEGFKKKA